MSWTDERINTLKKMWKEGKSAAEIAKVLGKGVTRNAVIGKAHRMGLSGRPSPIKKPVAPKKETPVRAKEKAAPAPVKPLAKKAVSAPVKNPLLTKEAEEIKKMDREAVQIGGGVALIDLSERMCKWPIGDPRDDDFSFCGRTIRPGTPYCPEHAAMAYQTSSRRGNTAIGRGAKVVVEEVVEEEVEEVVDDAADEADDDTDEAVA